MTHERDHKDNNPDSHRLQTLKRSVLLIGIVQSNKNWQTVNQLTRKYRDSVGEVNRRTIFRYMIVFEQIGLVEMKTVKIRGKDVKHYRWLDWPLPILN